MTPLADFQHAGTAVDTRGPSEYLKRTLHDPLLVAWGAPKPGMSLI